MNLILFGAPGIGKGTIAGMLSKHFKIPHLSSGDIIRNEIKLNTKCGIKAKPFVDKGLLVPDELIIGLIKEELKEKDCKNGIIFDGFPRTLVQAEHLDKTGIKIKKVINFVASEKTIIERVSGRRICPKCKIIYHIKNLPPKKDDICDKCGSHLYQRKDDELKTVKKRLVIYEEKTKPLIDYYKKKNLIQFVDTEKPLSEIFEDTLKSI